MRRLAASGSVFRRLLVVLLMIQMVLVPNTFRTDTYAVHVSTGAKGNSLRGDVFYDRNNRVVAGGDLAGATAAELAYDGAGRLYQSRTVFTLETTRYASGAFNYRAPVPDPEFSSSNASAMTGGDDKVLTLVHNVLNAAGLITEQHAFDMNHTDGSSGIDLSNHDDYVRQSVYAWHDEADRTTTVADYGSGDATAGAGLWKYAAIPSRPGTAPTASSETRLVSRYAYHDDTGRLETLTDPAGFTTKLFFDDLGRETWLAENYDDFSPATLSTISDGTDPSKDRVAKTDYAGFGLTTRLIAYNGSSTAAEETLYLFEDAVSAGRLTSTIYPDSSDTTSAGTDQVKLAYHLDGRPATRTDQRGTVITFGYDTLRRPQSQQATTLGGATDGAVRSITTGYDTLGRVAKRTSHGNQTDDPNNTADVANQITYVYNDLSQITESNQSHQGAAIGATPDVNAAYDPGASGGVFVNGRRQVSTTYPSGRVVYRHFGSGTDLEERLLIPKRLRETNGAGTTLVEYSHTGSGMTVVTDDQPPALKLDLYGGTSGTYAGLDRFGRTIDHRWYDYTSGTVDRARYAYGYDFNSNRTWKEDPVAAAATVNLDEFFAYDGLDRLTAADRGDLNGGKTAISTLAFAQDFDLDQLNNWATFTEDADGDATLDLDQDRTHNDANEITDVTETTGPAWTTPAHDAAGNMTSVPQPAAPTGSYTLTWDAWDRLVKVADGASTVAEYEYDGLHRRIVKSVYAAGSLDHTEHFYLSQDDQVLEVRHDASTNAERQFTWGERYIDDLVFRTRDTDANGTLDETLYALQDANWHITALADTSGTVVERFRYDPYGKSTVLDANFAVDGDGVSDTDWEYRFTSREHDAETGLHYFRYRYYHDGLGRFIGRDPLEYIDGLSLYAGYFVPDDLDPLGQSPMSKGCFLALKKGAKEALKDFISNKIEKRLKTWAGKKGLKERSKDISNEALDILSDFDRATSFDPWSFGSWASEGFEMVPIAGDAYGGYKFGKAAGEASVKLKALEKKMDAAEAAAARAIAEAKKKLKDAKKAKKGFDKEPGQQFEEITDAQAFRRATRPKTKGPGADPDWEGAKKRPKDAGIESTDKSSRERCDDD